MNKMKKNEEKMKKEGGPHSYPQLWWLRFTNEFRSDLLPLEVKWTCTSARKELRFTQDECPLLPMPFDMAHGAVVRSANPRTGTLWAQLRTFMPNPAILRPVFLTPIFLHTSLNFSCMLDHSSSPLDWQKEHNTVFVH